VIQVRALESNIADGGPAQIDVVQNSTVQLRLLNADTAQIKMTFPSCCMVGTSASAACPCSNRIAAAVRSGVHRDRKYSTLSIMAKS
jgi:hypothetical protein